MKRLASLSLAAIMAFGMLAGCRSANTTPTPNVAPTPNAAATPAPTNQKTGGFADYSKGFPQNVTIEIPVYERAFEGWNVTDNYYTRWVQQEFGKKYNVNVKFVSITRQSEVTDYQQLLASGQAPDIIFHYDMPQALAYYSEDVMQPINWDEIANYAPTYWAKNKAAIEQYSSVNNEKIFFFAERPMAYNWVNLIRKDWVEKVGMKVEDITSLEKFNEMLLKWKQAGLGVNGEKLWRNNFTINYPYRDWPIDEKYRALYSDLSVADFDTIATERYLRNLNYQYNNGLVDKEFYLRDEDGKAKAEFVAGKTGTFISYLTSNSDVISATLANNPTAEFASLDLKSQTPEGLQPQERAYWPFGMIMGINYKTTELERIAIWMYLDWLSQPDNLFKFQNGVEGQNYTLDSEGIAAKKSDYKGESVLSQNNNKDYWCLVTESAQYADPAKNRIAQIRNWAPKGYEKIIQDNIAMYERNEKYRTPDALFSVVLQKVPKYKADLNNLWQELYVQCATCPADKFDATYAAAKKQYLDAGYQEILDEKKAAISAGNYK